MKLSEEEGLKSSIFDILNFSSYLHLVEIKEEKEELMLLWISKNVQIYLHTPKYMLNKDIFLITAIRSMLQEKNTFMFYIGHILDNREFKVTNPK